MGFQLSYFKIMLKLMLLKCCTQYVSKFGNLSSGHRTGKGQFSFQLQKGNATECSHYHTVVLISHASKVMLKILQAGLQEYIEELYKKDLNDLDNHDGVITHLEPDILECEVKWP